MFFAQLFEQFLELSIPQSPRKLIMLQPGDSTNYKKYLRVLKKALHSSGLNWCNKAQCQGKVDLECNVIERNKMINKERKANDDNNKKTNHKNASSENFRAVKIVVATSGEVISAASAGQIPCMQLWTVGF